MDNINRYQITQIQRVNTKEETSVKFEFTSVVKFESVLLANGAAKDENGEWTNVGVTPGRGYNIFNIYLGQHLTKVVWYPLNND